MILIWQFGEHIEIAKLTYAIIDPFILQAWVFLHTVLKSANLKSCQQHCLSKPPNIMSTNISAYTVHRVFMCLCTYILLYMHVRVCAHAKILKGNIVYVPVYVWRVCVCWCCTDCHILEMSQHPIISTSRQLIF